ncbi:hypothetical protein CALCODRAFT_44844 [Calocera cornea HHB12733]|uniref:Uncharacterized protein n=1 Tax=Calocera cornea HHB12733 TaxID=1353952 RepID=A0A165IXZ4_9BASI|nr:hypothetical protein CALCODRAFT_44844 [Calocera cornea HHB12733]
MATLSAWIDLKQHGLSLSGGALHFMLTGTSLLLLGALTTCVNTIIAPAPIYKTVHVLHHDWDFGGDAFESWFLDSRNSTRADCSWWMPYGPCLDRMLLPAVVDAGQATAGNDTLLTILWDGRSFPYSGTTSGTLLPDPETVFFGWFPDAHTIKSWNWNFEVMVQGLSTTVECVGSNTSPLSFDTPAPSPTPTQSAGGISNSTVGMRSRRGARRAPR